MTETDICVVLRALSLRTIGEEAAGEIERLRATERESFQKYVDANEALIEAHAMLREAVDAMMNCPVRDRVRDFIASAFPSQMPAPIENTGE